VGNAVLNYVVPALVEGVTGKQARTANHVEEGLRKWKLQHDAEADEVAQERRRRGER
jgi:hypothetical protein